MGFSHLPELGLSSWEIELLGRLIQKLVRARARNESRRKHEITEISQTEPLAASIQKGIYDPFYYVKSCFRKKKRQKECLSLIMKIWEAEDDKRRG